MQRVHPPAQSHFHQRDGSPAALEVTSGHAPPCVWPLMESRSRIKTGRMPSLLHNQPPCHDEKSTPIHIHMQV